MTAEQVVEKRRLAPTTILTINSTIAAALGVVFAFFIDSLGRWVVGALLDRGPVLYNNRVEFTTGGSDLALAAGAAASIVAGIIFLAIYPGSRAHDASRLAVLWLILHCFRQGFVQMAMVPFDSDADLTKALATLDLPGGFDVVIGAAGAIGILLVSLAAAPAFLAYAPSRDDIAGPRKRLGFVARVAVLAGVLGALLAVPFFLPDPGTGLIAAVPLGAAFTLITLLASPGTKHVQAPQYPVEQNFSWGLAGTFVVTLVVFRFFLSRGIPLPPNPDGFFAQ
ncbi:MAG TPA: hypothetical protein VID03_06190 [Acidimicrobiia bacterium]|jgi:hypothetical protein